MQKALLFVALAAVIAFVYADLPQGISVVPLTNNVAMNGRIPDGRPEGLDYYTNVYSFYVPANTSYLNVSLVLTSDYEQCDALYGFYRSNGAPCTEDNYPYQNWFCSNVPDYYVYSSGSTNNFFITPGYGQYQSEFVTGQTVWFGVANYYSYDNNCTYTVTVNAVSICSLPQVTITADLETSSVTLACANVVNVPAAGVTTLNVSVPAPASDERAFALFTMDVPLETASINVRLNVSADVNVYGTQFSALGTSGNYKCEDSTYESCGTDYYCINVTCATPRMGLYYINVYSSYYAWNGTMTFWSVQCPSGYGGPTCNFTSTQWFLNNTTPLSITVPYNDYYSVYNEAIYWIDVPANYTGPDFYINAASTASSAYLIPRINGYPTDGDAGNELYNYYSISSSGSYFTIGSFDQVFAGRYYFAFACEDSSHSCVINISFNNTTPSSSSTSATSATSATSMTSASSTTVSGSTSASSTTVSGSTTRAPSTTSIVSSTSSTAAVTTAHSSGVEVIVPSIVLLLVAFLLF